MSIPFPHFFEKQQETLTEETQLDIFIPHRKAARIHCELLLANCELKRGILMELGLRIFIIYLAALLAAGLVSPAESLPEASPPPEVPGTFVPIPPAPSDDTIDEMADISPADWFYAYVRLGYEHGFLRGTDGRFDPSREITRAEFITILGRLHLALGGIDYGELLIPYTDTEETFYTPYLTWATHLDIVQGDEFGRFRPNDVIRRDEMAVTLGRYIEAYDLYESLEHAFEDRGLYADWEEIAPWAYHEAHLLRNHGIMHGMRPPGAAPDIYLFRPETSALRCEAAAIFARLFVIIFDATA